MGKVIIFAAVSLDGFIAADDDTVGPLFDWYNNGDVAVTFSDEERVFHTTAATADFLNATAPRMAAGVLGRRLFDITDGWHGRPPNGEHAFVVTHEPPTDLGVPRHRPVHLRHRRDRERDRAGQSLRRRAGRVGDGRPDRRTGPPQGTD